MSVKSKIALSFLLVALANASNAQDCADFHSRFCPIPDMSYYYDQQSSSFPLKDNDTIEVRVIVFEKTDYYVSLCTQKRSRKIHLRILEDTPERKLIYDNEKENYIDYVTFSNDMTRKLIFEVAIQLDKKNKLDLKAYCAGLLVAKRIRVDAF